jgi:hypothetical protein
MLKSHHLFLISILLLPAPAPAQNTPIAKPPFALSEKTTLITTPTLPDGTPDYLSFLNARNAQGVTNDNNAFVPFLRLEFATENPESRAIREKARQYLHLQDTPVKFLAYDGYASAKGFSKEATRKLAIDIMSCSTKLWNAKDFPDVADYVQTEGAALDMLVDAAARPRWFCPVLGTGADPRLFNAKVPSGPIVLPARVLAARAMLRGAASDFDGFQRDILAVMRTARYASGPLFTDYQVGEVMQNRACQAVGSELGKGLLNAAQCDSLAKSLADLPPFHPPSLVTHHWTILDCACLVAAGKPPPQEALDARFSSIDVHATDWNIALREINALAPQLQSALADTPYTKLNARLSTFNDELDVWKETPLPKRTAVPKFLGESRDQYSRHVGQALFSCFDYAWSTAEMFRRDTELYQGMLNALLAAATYRAKTGDWPDTLDQLVPAYLKEAPTDHFSPSTKDPVKFLVNINVARIYSVGPNGIDDLGVADGPARKDDISLGCLDDPILP